MANLSDAFSSVLPKTKLGRLVMGLFVARNAEQTHDGKKNWTEFSVDLVNTALSFGSFAWTGSKVLASETVVAPIVMEAGEQVIREVNTALKPTGYGLSGLGDGWYSQYKQHQNQEAFYQILYNTIPKECLDPIISDLSESKQGVVDLAKKLHREPSLKIEATDQTNQIWGNAGYIKWLKDSGHLASMQKPEQYTQIFKDEYLPLINQYNHARHELKQKIFDNIKSPDGRAAIVEQIKKSSTSNDTAEKAISALLIFFTDYKSALDARGPNDIRDRKEPEQFQLYAPAELKATGITAPLPKSPNSANYTGMKGVDQSAGADSAAAAALPATVGASPQAKMGAPASMVPP